ncbi:MAG: hypothetical protein PHI59_04520 [Candidatus Omnitrophica bacterium]|nr:hypothetical protein [Candidatus Omnitrophota bacterium]
MKTQNGIALITVLVVLFLIFALVGTFLFLATNARLLNERYYENSLALYLAEAGIDYAIWEIDFGSADFSDWSGNPATEATKTMNNFQDTDGNIYGNISISVYNFGQEIVTVRSTGTFSSLTGPQLSRTVQVFLKKHKLFSYAILTSEGIDISGSAKVDSYNSINGPYGGSNVYQNGDIATNSQENPAILITGNNAEVNGNAATGPSGTVSDAHDSITGTTNDNAEVFMPPVTVPSSLTVLTSGGTINHDETLWTGSYKFDSLDLNASKKLTLNGNVDLYFIKNPSISLTGSGEIVVNGTVNIYFDGDVQLAGKGILNNSQDPSSLTLYGTDTVGNVSITGVGALHGTVYSPSAGISISGNSEIYGAVATKNTTVSGVAGNTAIHFDERLLVDSPTIGYDPYLWEEK